MATKSRVDKPFLFAAITLMVFGFFIFSSASLGLLARSGTNYASVAFSQTVLGLFMGTIAMVAASNLDFKILKKHAFYMLLFGIFLCVLVLIPGIGFEHGGARRWLMIAGISFQPVEFFKLAFIVYFAAWCAGMKDKMHTFQYGFLPLLILLALASALLLFQPDTDNLFLIGVTGSAMFISVGGKWRYILMLGIAGLIGLTILVLSRPYLMQRVQTFFSPHTNSQGSSYQIQQSLIAIGSGGLFGRGFGQSVQKFNFLPEPIGDSIFAVAAEEFGFVGAVFLIYLFVFFATRGLKIASRVPDTFGRLVVIGIVIMIITQSFFNIGAMLGVLPLSGITLPFVSHGGTSLFITLLSVGVILSISKTQIVKR
jgi:cell division protein FtsW